LSVSAGSAAYADKNVGVGKAVTFSGFGLSGADAGNYSLSAQPASTTADITAKAVTITGTTVDSTKTYDGGAAANIDSGGSLSGVIGGDTVTVSAGSAAYADKNVGVGKAVTFSGFGLSGADAGNYSLSAQPASTTADITAKAVTITGAAVDSTKTYDGGAAASIDSGGSLSGVIGGDTVTVSEGSAAYADKNVGAGKAVTFTGFGLSGADAGNYSLSAQPASTTAGITAKGLTFTGSVLAAKYYDGVTTTVLADEIQVTGATSFSGLVGGEGFTLNTSGVTVTGTFASADLGTTADSLSYTGSFGLGTPTGSASASNYSLAAIVTLPGVIHTNSIFLEATTNAVNQDVKLNKYFANAFTVCWDWADDPAVAESVAAATTNTYASPGTYDIELKPADRTYQGYGVWTFQSFTSSPLIPTSGTTAQTVTVSSMPPMGRFMADATTAPGYFFHYFNRSGALTSLPAGSFDTSGIAAAGGYFFSAFNSNGNLTSLPAGSFDTSNIAAAGNGFFSTFNDSGALASLPDGSFDTSGITTAGTSFFSRFNWSGALASLPAGSFDTSNISGTVGDSFYYGFNYYSDLTSLPDDSFNTSNISGTVGVSFFSEFNHGGALASLPAGSFDTSNITTSGGAFFYSFNYSGDLASLPAGSFDTSAITTASNNFFNSFNWSGALASLPDGSFNTSNIATVGVGFFATFNYNGALASLPSSFKWPALTQAQASQNSNFNLAFNSTTAINALASDDGSAISALAIIGGCVAPNEDRNTFSSNFPGYSEVGLAANWKV
jgi:hypothetical protein